MAASEQLPEWALEAAERIAKAVGVDTVSRGHNAECCACADLIQNVGRHIAEACREQLSLVKYLMDENEQLKAQHADEIAAAGNDLQVASRIVDEWVEDSDGLVHIHKDVIRKAINAATAALNAREKEPK